MIFSSSYSNLHDKFPHMIGISELKICTKIKFNPSFYSCNNEIFNGNNLSIENSFLYILRFSSNSSFSFKIEYHHENKIFFFLSSCFSSWNQARILLECIHIGKVFMSFPWMLRICNWIREIFKSVLLFLRIL